LQLDIRGFFFHIDMELLLEIVAKRVHYAGFCRLRIGLLGLGEVVLRQ